MITARLTRNRHDLEISIHGRPVAVEDAQVIYEGKRQMLVLRVSDFKLLPESKCPERNRYERVMQAAGSEEAVRELQPACSMLNLNPSACTGCPDRPI